MGLFDRFRKAPAARDYDPQSMLSMLALSTSPPPSAVAILEGFQAQWPTSMPPLTVDAQPEAAVATSGGTRLVLAALPIPIPWPDLELPAKIAWHWPGATAALRAHRSHLVAFTSSVDLSPRDLALLHLRYVSSLAKVEGVAGIYRGDIRQVFEPTFFRKLARGAKSADLPTVLLVGLAASRQQDGNVVLETIGLPRFGALDMEVHSASVPPPQLLEFGGNMASYIVNSGATIADGETLGYRDGIGGRAKRARSQFRKGLEILRVQLEPSTTSGSSV